LVIVLAMPAF